MNTDKFYPLDKNALLYELHMQGITQRKISEQLGISYEHLNRCISKGRISKAWLYAIAKLLDVSVGTLTGTDDYGLTYFAEERGKLLNAKESIFIQLFHLCGYTEEQFMELEEYEIENLFTDINILIGYFIRKSREKVQHYPSK